MVATGNCSIWSVGQLHMQPSMGRKYQSRKASLNLCVRKKSTSGCCRSCSRWALAMRVHSALKRITSANMRQNRGLTKLLRWAKTLFRSVPLHSSVLPFTAPGTLTENDMLDGAVSTCSSANRLIKLG